MPRNACKSALVSCALACLLACSSSSSTPAQAPVDLKITKISDLKGGAIATNGQNEKDVECKLRLVASNIIKSSPGCYLDEHISEGPGELHYACDGNGRADAVFGEQRFVGVVSQGVLRIAVTTELDWEDGCRWGTTATISGFVPSTYEQDGVSHMSSGGNQVQWSYADRVITGSDCSGVCTAWTHVTMSQTSSPITPPPQADDDDDVDMDP